jgi:hypothetical protein
MMFGKEASFLQLNLGWNAEPNVRVATLLIVKNDIY